METTSTGTFGPFGITQARLDHFPLYANCHTSLMRDALTKAAHIGYFVNPFPKREASYYSWCSNVLIPVVEFTPAKTRAFLLLDLLPSCQEFPVDALEPLEDLLRPFKASGGIMRVRTRASYIDSVMIRDIDELGQKLVDFTTRNAVRKEPERTRFEEMLNRPPASL